MAGSDQSRRRRRTAVLEHRGLRSPPRTYLSPKRLGPGRHLLWENAVPDRKVRPRSGAAQSTGASHAAGAFDAAGNILRRRGHPARAGACRPGRGRFLPGRGIRRRRGQDSCPRTRGPYLWARKSPRPREASPQKDAEPLRLGLFAPRTRRAEFRQAAPPKRIGLRSPHTSCGPRTWRDPARRGDKARRLKQQQRPAPRRLPCRPDRRRCDRAP